jgi:hypothetical protein
VTHFEDGSPYRYGQRSEVSTPALNVGWLDGSMRFPMGDTSEELHDKLAWLCAIERVNATRGIHRCTICRSSRDDFHGLDVGRTRHLLGTAEIRVVGSAATYAAPNLVIHYVVDHRYLPPEDFVAGVLARSDRFGAGSWTLSRGPYWKVKRRWQIWRRGPSSWK